MKFFLLFLFFILKISIVLAIDTKAEHAIVFDWNTNEVLFEKNADEIISPASMTKIMTTIVAFDLLEQGKISLDDQVIISEKAWCVNN